MYGTASSEVERGCVDPQVSRRDRTAIRWRSPRGIIAPMPERHPTWTVPRVQRAIRLGAAILREERAVRRAARSVPRPVPWEWAEPRLVPLLAGPRLDHEGGDEPVRAIAAPGCAVVFGLDLGRVFPLVDVPIAERWECSPAQLLSVAMTNLERRARLVPRTAVTRATLSGHIVQILRRPRGWAASLVLAPEELARLFGPDDIVLAAPGQSLLMGFRTDMPTRLVGDIVVDFEKGEAWPLWLDPFVLADGELSWGGTTDDGE